MVDWDRVEELRSKGWDWDEIADDPKVGFHPDASVRDPGSALRGLYHRQRQREGRRKEVVKPTTLSKEDREKEERRWTLTRLGYLLVPVVGLWCLFAYLVPSPIGLVLPAIPYLALGLVVVVFVLLYSLLRSTKPRWSAVYRTTVISGVILGLVFSGMIGFGGYLLGCPILPPTSAGTSLSAPNWMQYNVNPWQENGAPVFYFYGATWCPYCSASSWSIWKALSGYGTLSNTAFMYSAEDSIPEVVLAGASYTSPTNAVTFVVSEDTSGSTGTFPTTTSCTEQAYVTAYSANSIPFVAINGQFVHGGYTLIQPTQLQSGTGATFTTGQMEQQVGSANGSAWNTVQGQTWWMMAFIAKANGVTVATLPQQPYYASWANKAIWGANTQSSVSTDLAQIG